MFRVERLIVLPLSPKRLSSPPHPTDLRWEKLHLSSQSLPLGWTVRTPGELHGLRGKDQRHPFGDTAPPPARLRVRVERRWSDVLEHGPVRATKLDRILLSRRRGLLVGRLPRKSPPIPRITRIGRSSLRTPCPKGLET